MGSAIPLKLTLPEGDETRLITIAEKIATVDIVLLPFSAKISIATPLYSAPHLHFHLFYPAEIPLIVGICMRKNGWYHEERPVI